MKKFLFPIIFAVSLIFCHTLALAENPTQANDKSREIGNAQEAQKGLHEPILIENGEQSWVLHQPKENSPKYFSAVSQEDSAGTPSSKTPTRQG